MARRSVETAPPKRHQDHKEKAQAAQLPLIPTKREPIFRTIRSLQDSFGEMSWLLVGVELASILSLLIIFKHFECT